MDGSDASWGHERSRLREKNKGVHFVCDEANLLGKMDQISDALTIGRGFGIRFCSCIIQDLGQLKKWWPDGAYQTVLANVSQVFFAVNDPDTATYCEKKLGKSTVIVSQAAAPVPRNSGHHNRGSRPPGAIQATSNDNWQQHGRELLQASEIMNLPSRIAIIFTPGVPPIWTTLVRYYEAGFRKAFIRFRPSVKAFAEAAFILAGIGFFAVLLTLAVNRKLTSEHRFYPVANEQWLEQRR